jgi:hypothetical protein
MKKTLPLMLVASLLFAILSVGCADKGVTNTSEPPDDTEEEINLDPDFIKLTEDGSAFVLGILRTGNHEDDVRNAFIEINAEVPLTITGDDWSFSGKGYGMWVREGSAGPMSSIETREVIYEVSGKFLPSPKCDIHLDSVLEEIGPGEICVTIPIVGTTCEPFTESETEYYEFQPMVLPFKGEGGYWELETNWTAGGYGSITWTDQFFLTDYVHAIEMKIFEYLGCIPKY